MSGRAGLAQQLCGSCRPKLNAHGWENSQFSLVDVGLGGLGCFYGNYISPDILVAL